MFGFLFLWGVGLVWFFVVVYFTGVGRGRRFV